MNPKQIGLGVCVKHGIPVLQAINQPGTAGVCFECQEEAKPKTGRTVVVKRETGDTKASASPLEGRVEFEEVGVDHALDTAFQRASTPQLKANGITVVLTLDELFQPDIVRVLLARIYDGIDNMAPPATINDAKRIFGLQEKIEKLIKSMEK